MNIKKIIFSALFVLSFGLFTGIANAGCGKVVVASQNWASAELMADCLLYTSPSPRDRG